jgi:hypothetical protein
MRVATKDTVTSCTIAAKKSQQKCKTVKLKLFNFPSIIYSLSTTKSICSTAANKLTANLVKTIETKLLDVCSIIHVILKQ